MFGLQQLVTPATMTLKSVLSIILLIQCTHLVRVNAADDQPSETERQLKQLCPELDSNWYLYRYHNDTEKCYEVTTMGPCSKNMIYYGFDNSEIYGYCDCDCDDENSHRVLIFHPKTNQCYFIYQQGYCKAGRWLTLNSKTEAPRCVINPCSGVVSGSGRGRRHNEQDEEVVLFKNRCVKINSHQPECAENEVIKFQEGLIDPICSIKNSLYALAVVASPSKCRPGSVHSIAGKCQTTWTWD